MEEQKKKEDHMRRKDREAELERLRARVQILEHTVVSWEREADERDAVDGEENRGEGEEKREKGADIRKG